MNDEGCITTNQDSKDSSLMQTEQANILIAAIKICEGLCYLVVLVFLYFTYLKIFAINIPSNLNINNNIIGFILILLSLLLATLITKGNLLLWMCSCIIYIIKNAKNISLHINNILSNLNCFISKLRKGRALLGIIRLTVFNILSDLFPTFLISIVFLLACAVFQWGGIQINVDKMTIFGGASIIFALFQYHLIKQKENIDRSIKIFTETIKKNVIESTDFTKFFFWLSEQEISEKENTIKAGKTVSDNKNINDLNILIMDISRILNVKSSVILDMYNISKTLESVSKINKTDIKKFLRRYISKNAPPISVYNTPLSSEKKYGKIESELSDTSREILFSYYPLFFSEDMVNEIVETVHSELDVSEYERIFVTNINLYAESGISIGYTKLANQLYNVIDPKANVNSAKSDRELTATYYIEILVKKVNDIILENMIFKPNLNAIKTT